MYNHKCAIKAAISTFLAELLCWNCTCIPIYMSRTSNMGIPDHTMSFKGGGGKLPINQTWMLVIFYNLQETVYLRVKLAGVVLHAGLNWRECHWRSHIQLLCSLPVQPHWWSYVVQVHILLTCTRQPPTSHSITAGIQTLVLPNVTNP